MGRLLAGMHVVDITPPIGTPMAGYGERKGLSQGVLDPLMATALVLDDGVTQVAIVSIDWIGVDAAFTAQVRALVESACGIPGSHLMLAASHTHAGPTLRERYHEEYADATLADVTARKIAGAVVMAAASRTEVQWGVGHGQAPGIGANRRDPSAPADDSVWALRLEGASGLLGGAFNFACHPTVLDHNNLKLSADYPGAARRALSAIYGDQPSFLFLNGASADISTRHVRRDSSNDEATRFGRMLAGQVIHTMESIATVQEATIAVTSVAVEMPLRALPSEADAAQRFAEAEAEVERLRAAGLPPGRGQLRTALVDAMGARGTLQLVRLNLTEPIRTEFQGIRLGDAVWIAVPGELFTASGEAIRELAPDRPVQIVTYANDSIGYILTPEVHAAGGYEAGITRLGPAAEEAVLSATRTILNNLVVRED
jgi:neutral ceramidase